MEPGENFGMDEDFHAQKQKADEAIEKGLAEIDQQIEEIKDLPVGEKYQRVEGKRHFLQNRAIDTSQMSPEEIIRRFVAEETKDMF